MKCAKSVDELYEEVKEFSLVITNDAALATALNARIDTPVVGHFAMTPKQIAAHVASRVETRPLYSELQVISSISNETGLGLKYVHSEVENFKEIRRYTKEVRKYLYSEASREVYDSYEPLPTLERLMGAFNPNEDEFYKGESVAVIQPEFFDQLDKQFTPNTHEIISIFKDAEYDIGTIYEIGNDRQLAENAVDIICKGNPGDFALVLNTTSPIADAVRAALYRRNVPFINSLNVRDLSQIRDYLQFITLALEFDTVRVKNVKELFSNYNGFFYKGKEGFLLSKQTDRDMSDRAYELWKLMRDIREKTYSQICDELCDKRARIQVGLLISELKVSDVKVSRLNLSDVKYAVDNVKELHHNEEIPENEKRGVLLVDCNNSVYIDRPVVIYLGMEQDWNKNLVGKQYIDIQDETEINVDRLKALIQQGSVRYYLVNSTKGGKPARPCMLFDLLYKKPIDSFRLMCGRYVRGRWHRDIEAKDPAPEAVSGTKDGFDNKFYKSSFDNYYRCPRRYMYGLFLDTPDEKHTAFGQLIHSFAEFYICYPETVKELGLDHFVGLISDRYSGLSSPLMEELDTDMIRHAMDAIVRYIEHLGVEFSEPTIPLKDKKYPNIFMKIFGKEYTRGICEKQMESEIYPIKGVIDLFWDGIVIDFKTGIPGKISEISDAMILGSKAKYPEFQAPIYLQLAKENGGYRDRFELFYAMDNDTARDGVPITANTRAVILSDTNIKETMTSSKEYREFLSQDLSKTLRDHTDDILDTIQERGSEDPSSWDSDMGLVYAILGVIGKSDAKTNVDNVQKGLRKIAGYSKSGLLSFGTTIILTPEYVETVMKEIARMHAEMRERGFDDYPASPRNNCKECPFFQVCTREPIVLEEDDRGVEDE